MSWLDTSVARLETIDFMHFSEKNIQVLVKRDDLIDPVISGNKFRKLKYILELAASQRKNGILTPGGAYSNHLAATAAACNRLGLRSAGLVRGEELTADSNANLKLCASLGMELIFLSRGEYAERDEPERQEIWKARYSDLLFVPEGGATYHGLIGCQELALELPADVTDVFVAQGTTATSCGLLLGLPESCTLHAVPVLKEFQSLHEMRRLLYPFLLDNDVVSDYLKRVEVHDRHHFGGYGKVTPQLIDFVGQIRRAHDLPLDTIYTGKAFFAMFEYLSRPDVHNRKVVFIHTGGLLNSRVA
jgi:1-aminocyclopropane-1-carboxylate deaminase